MAGRLWWWWLTPGRASGVLARLRPRRLEDGVTLRRLEDGTIRVLE